MKSVDDPFEELTRMIEAGIAKAVTDFNGEIDPSEIKRQMLAAMTSWANAEVNIKIDLFGDERDFPKTV